LRQRRHCKHFFDHKYIIKLFLLKTASLHLQILLTPHPNKPIYSSITIQTRLSYHHFKLIYPANSFKFIYPITASNASATTTSNASIPPTPSNSSIPPPLQTHLYYHHFKLIYPAHSFKFIYPITTSNPSILPPLQTHLSLLLLQTHLSPHTSNPSVRPPVQTHLSRPPLKVIRLS
jgi:hypothetical protein